MPLLGKLLNFYKGLFTSTGSSRADTEKIQHILTRMEGITALFYSNLDRKYRPFIGVQYDGLVVSCKYKGRPCTKDNFKYFMHPTFINCYTFQSNDTDNSGGNNLLVGPQNGLSLVLRSEPNPNFMYTTVENTGNVDSIRVAIHPKNTVPFLMNKGFNLEPGKSTSISLMMKRYERLGSPYTKCKKPQTFELDSRTFKATNNDCREKCIVQTLRDQCNCTSTFFEDLTISDHDYCLAYQEGMGAEVLNNRSYCETNFIQTLPDLKCDHCIWDCHEIDYDVQIAFSDWPHENKIQNFMKKFMSVRPCTDTIKAYYATLQKKASISHDVCPDTSYSNDTRLPFSMVAIAGLIEDPTELFVYARPDFLDVFRYEMDVPKTYYSVSNIADLNTKWVKDSFYRLNVYFRQSTVEEHTQVASFSFADLWSGIGGILGLWLGISVMTIIELVSFVVNFFTKCLKAESEMNRINVMPAPGADYTKQPL